MFPKINRQPARAGRSQSLVPFFAFTPAAPLLSSSFILSASSLDCSSFTCIAPLSAYRPLLRRMFPVRPPRVAVRTCEGPHYAIPSMKSAADVSGLGPRTGHRFGLRHWGEGLRADIARRAPLYVKDWKDGGVRRAVPAVLFLYFACLAPVVAFGGLTMALTGGAMGVVEFLVSSAACGMFYALFAGQPLTIIGPTGLTLAFTTALYGFCRGAGVAFLGVYAWVGLWTAAILALLSVANVSDLIKYCTRFTDDIFNSLIATNFVYEASKSLLANFKSQTADKTRAFVSLALALGTYIIGRSLSALRSSQLFSRRLSKRVRGVLADFGPLIAIVSMSIAASFPLFRSLGLARMAVPDSFALSGGRPWIAPFLSVPPVMRVMCIVPALLLTCLFFLDQNISVRVVNSPSHKLRKGPGYHLDLMVLAICTAVCSVFGLPWMCAATVQSVNHVRSLAALEPAKDGDGQEVITSVVENRLTGFSIHALIGVSLLLLPLVRQVPMAVISGLFLFLGRNMMNGNDFLSRTTLLFKDPDQCPKDSVIKKVPSWQVHGFTGVQLACLGLLWTLKLNKKTSLFFPSVIATLMFIRSRILPHLFPESTLRLLDSDIGEENTEHEHHHSPGGHEPATETLGFGYCDLSSAVHR